MACAWASRLVARPWTSSVSRIWSPIVNTGFSAVIGSWKMSAISAPRTWRMSRSLRSSRSRPLKRSRPELMRPGGWTRRMIENAVTDLPLPDSPTSPSVSPERISKLTSSTAGTEPDGVSKTVVRPSTLSRGAAVTAWPSPDTRRTPLASRPRSRPRSPGPRPPRESTAPGCCRPSPPSSRRRARRSTPTRFGRPAPPAVARSGSVPLPHRPGTAARRPAVESANLFTPTTTDSPESMALLRP